MYGEYTKFYQLKEHVLEDLTFWEKCITDCSKTAGILKRVEARKEKTEAMYDFLELVEKVKELASMRSYGMRDSTYLDLKNISDGTFYFPRVCDCSETTLCLENDAKLVASLEELYDKCRSAYDRLYGECVSRKCGSDSSRYEKQLNAFYKLYAIDLDKELTTPAQLTTNTQLIELLSTLYYAVHVSIEDWHDRQRKYDEINETDLAEPDELIETLRVINNAVLFAIESFGNPEKEENAVFWFQKRLEQIDSQLNRFELDCIEGPVADERA